MNKTKFFIYSLIFSGALITCRSVKRVTIDQSKDLSGDWNQKDYKATSEELARKIVNHPWRDKFVADYGRIPKVLFGKTVNKTSEIGISNVLSIVTSNIEEKLSEKGGVEVLQGSHFRDAIRAERVEQGSFASPETRAKLGEELGADAMFVVEITSLEDVIDGREVRTYMVVVKLVNVNTGGIMMVVRKDDITKYIKS